MIFFFFFFEKREKCYDYHYLLKEKILFPFFWKGITEFVERNNTRARNLEACGNDDNGL